MRNRFDAQLEALNRELTTMGSLCEDAISAVIVALCENDMSLLSKVRSIDSQIDESEREIESICMKLLLMQQPVARDLRTISSALKMISDMERIGDQASDIAEITGYLENSKMKNEIKLREMANATIKMVIDSVESFVLSNLETAESVMVYDDTVDALFDEIKKELISLIATEPDHAEECLDLLMIAKYFERIGDHAVNIAEWVEFSITGYHQRGYDLSETFKKD